MNGKSFFVDLTLCTACRGCQVACKQWKKLPAEKTRNMGSHQNPQDLSSKTLRLVRFNEVQDDKNKLNWFFFPEQCRHCIEPPCKYTVNMYAPGGVIQDPETGAVIMTDKAKTKVGKVESWELCPYNVPRQDPETGIWNKCDMCIDRVQMGMLPACVQSCPTGTMNFGDREEMLDLANKRLAAVKKTKPKAYLADPEDVRVIYLCESAPDSYHENLLASADQRKTLMANGPAPTKSSRRGFLTAALGKNNKA
ncbi:formate dehydrogenase iron-sulfur subunit [Maridesulfovibrio ferrireducens]|uniref:Formate dehydrogenase iron-sulfur subunit n=1 Tax=Maridesulfovibrio ferrireducens TaxID=246191 RepID=A0A1G9I0H1_9BACT|nr:4Fe-4S dicluster domain-containing protein [Maridesulfovibrio ferrireducens]SDL18582.1 formate dehydrogenase iron-sulfur subunit [Maridesulfovibrio ferrireducens]